MEFEKYLKVHAQKTEKILDKILSQFSKDVKTTNPKLSAYAVKLIKACKGGKRIRAVLCKLGFELTRGKLKQEIMKVAAAWEILHTALLIHDDIIDQSPQRRGEPSLYKALGGNHYGISQAITLGDIGLYLPIKIITDSKFDESIKIKVLSRFSQIVIDTGWGQVADVAKADKQFVNRYKTAKYTVAGPLILGVILAGGNKKMINNIGEFGENLGVAFQIKDDLLDGEEGSIKQALEYVTKAKKIIPKLIRDDKMRKLLESMADFMVERKK